MIECRKYGQKLIYSPEKSGFHRTDIMDISYTEQYPNRTKYIESKVKLLCLRPT